MELKTTSQFRKDYKRCRKRGLNMKLLQEVVDKLLAGEQLEDRYRDHGLFGKYIGFRECHVQPDWLLIYRIDNDLLILTAARTGTHSDLLGM